MRKSNILIVDDEQINRDILESMLEEDYNIYQASNGQEALELLEKRNPLIHLVLLDINMPVMDGFDTLRCLEKNTKHKSPPVIIISGDNAQETISEAYRLGAIDYFEKPFRVDIVRKCVQNILKLSSYEYTDSVTGGLNRKGFLEEADAFLNSVNRLDYMLIFLNIKNYKAFNAIFGNEIGDELLRSIYQAIEVNLNPPALVSRIESDHFAVIVKKDSIHLNDISNRLNLEWKHCGKNVNVYLKCGIYYMNDEVVSVAGMLDRAKIAMSSIIDEYASPYAIFDQEIQKNYYAQATVIQEFNDAITNCEFQVYYQPVVDVKTSKVVSCEALVRWKKPTGEMVSPGLFIPALEHDGYVSKLDNYIIKMVFDDIVSFSENNIELVPISINLSWMDFFDVEIKNTIIDSISHKYSQYIRYEVTETSFAAIGNNNAVNLMATLKANRIKLLLDDFGSGYSTFSMLDKYHFDILKIDMSLTRKIGINPNMESIIHHVIHMCHDMNIKVVCEGVETENQVQFLLKNNCDYIQGYYYSKPLSKSEFIEYLKKHQ